MAHKLYKNVLFANFREWRAMPIFRYLVDRSQSLILFMPNMFMASPDRSVEITIESYSSGRLRWRREWRSPGRLPLHAKYAFAYACYILVLLFAMPRRGWAMTTFPIFGFGRSVFKSFKRLKTVFWAWDHFGDMYPTFAKFDDHTARHADSFLVVSRAMLDVYAKRAPANRPSQHRAVVPHGLVISELVRRPIDGRLGYVGNVREEDGLTHALDALTFDKTLSLDVIGDGAYMPTIKERVSSLGIADRVRFLGRIEDKEAIDAATADWQIGLAAYARTPFTPYIDPGKIKTYWQQGIPVITTAVVPTADEIVTARAGEVVQKGTPEEIASAIARIRADVASYDAGVRLMRTRYDYRTLFDAGLAFMRT